MLSTFKKPMLSDFEKIDNSYPDLNDDANDNVGQNSIDHVKNECR